MCSSPMETTRLNALPARLSALAMEEFPTLSSALAARHHPPSWHQESLYTCAGIPEEDEEEEEEEDEEAERASNLEEEEEEEEEEERARRSFHQQSLASLCGQSRSGPWPWRHWQDCRVGGIGGMGGIGGGCGSTQVSLDSSDSDSV